MDINKSRTKNSRKCYKKTTKFINCSQKHSLPKNYHSGTEKLVHQSIQIANLQTEKYPAARPESCKYYIVKRRFSVKQRKLGKNGDYTFNSQEQAHGCKQTHINRFLIAPTGYDMEVDEFNKLLKKKFTSEKLKKRYDPYPYSAPVVNNELLHSKISSNGSKENACIMNNEFNSGNALLFQCSAASLQLEKSKIIETNKTNLNENFNAKQSNDNKKGNYNNINDILPKLMQQVTVYRILENLKGGCSYQNNSQDDIYSSMSTCSSSSSTREYYLPAVSSSTDTMHVASVLANRKLVELPHLQEEIILKQQNINQGNFKNIYNKNNSNLSPVYQQAPLKNEILPFSNIGMKDMGQNEFENSNHKIIKMLKDNNDGLLPFFPFVDFNSLMIKNKSKVFKNYEQSSVGVQTQENKIKEKDEDDSILFKTIKNKRIKLSKENFVVNNNPKNCDQLDMTMKKNIKHLNSLSLVTSQNCKNLMNNFNKANKEVIKILSEHLCDTHPNGNGKMSLDCKNSNSNLSNISLSRPKNRSISEDVLITVKEKGNKKVIQKPKSSLSVSNVKPQSTELPLYFKSYPNTSNDSLYASKPHFVKLNPFFDAGFKDPKISRLILSSKTLAGESDSLIHNAKIHPKFTNNNAKTFCEIQSEEKDVKSATMTEVAAKSVINEENKIEIKHSCTSNRTIFSTDSIIYGNKAFQKIREKFDLLKNKIQITKENKHFQGQGLLNKQRLITSKHSLKENFEDINNGKDSSQSVGNNSNMTLTSLNNSFSRNENHKKVGTVSLENDEFLDNKKCHLLHPKKLDTSNHQSENSVRELCHIDEKEKTNSFISIHSKSVDISLMDDEDELININFKSSPLKEQTTLSYKNEIEKSEKGTFDKNILLEKQTQVNMYLVETSNNQVQENISNELAFTEKKDIPLVENDKALPTAMMDDNSQAEETMSSNNDQAEAIMLNNNIQTEATLLNNNGQPVILYNSSGYPITDLNGRVLKNNLGAYLLNSDKYEDVVKKQLPVFDCDLMSVSSTCFNPTKVPFVKTQLKITDKCGNPVSLFNNVGWPLTNKDGFFLHDNHGKLLVAMDSFNFPLCCSNGSPVYLQNGAMLLSQKFKFIVTKPDSDSNSTIRSLNLRKRYDKGVVISHNMKDNNIRIEKSINFSNTMETQNEPNPKDFKTLNYLRTKKRKPNFRHNLFLPTEVPELMHEFFDNKARPKFSNNGSQGSIPQSPIPIFDREGNRLTDENGFPLKNKYGEYMLLLDKNGIALSDSCGGPIFDSNGKQLWLKDLYYLKKRPSFNYLYDRYTPPEHPYIDNSTSNNNQITQDSSDDLIPLLDLNFENEQNSEPIMNYIKENNIKAYDMDVKQIHFVQNKHFRPKRTPIQTNFCENISIPSNEKHYIQPPMTANVLLYETTSYQEEAEHRNSYESFSQQIHDCNIPYTYEQSIYEDNIFSEYPEIDDLEDYDDNYYYEQGFPENSEFHQDAEIQYYVDDNNYVVYY